MISIIVPVYNIQNYIQKCVTSILNQTLQNFELILVDDGSTDTSGKVCDMFALQDSRIHVIHKTNGGLSSARNEGTVCAAGEYICYIDGDDFIAPNYLEVLYENIYNNNAQIAVCSYRSVNEGEEYSTQENYAYSNVVYTGRQAATEIVKNSNRNMIIACGKLYHFSLKEKLIFPEGYVHEDEFVTYKVLYGVERVVVIDAPLYLYVQRGGSITNSNYSLKRLDKLLALNEAISFFENCEDKELLDCAIKRYLLNIQIAWYRVYKNMKTEKQTLDELRNKWLKQYKNHIKSVWQTGSVVDLVAVFVFRISPVLYCLFAEITLKIFPEI